MHTYFHRLSLVVLTVSGLLVSVPAALSAGPAEPYEQTFVITAYYSPKSMQCCYVRGSFEADVILNGRGTNGASGEEVHAGMAAAPPLYPFGTRIQLPGIGTVTVQDRGGAIQTLQSGAHRLDLWVGEGEEGLARALAFGVQTVRTTVYPTGTAQPAESMDLASLPAPFEKLRPYLAAGTDLDTLMGAMGERSLSVLLVQEKLKALGYFDGPLSGLFGLQTEGAVRSFQERMDVTSSSDGTITEETAAFLLAASEPATEVLPPVSGTVRRGSDPRIVREAQRSLRLLGYYHGRTDGRYERGLSDAILHFQLDEGVVSSVRQSGAGVIGPATRKALAERWQVRRVARRAKDLLAAARLARLMAERGLTLTSFLRQGDSGAQVRLLQRFLAKRGLLGNDRATGYFGAETLRAVVALQLRTRLIASDGDPAAGFVGPGTRRVLESEERTALMNRVRSYGWQAL